MAGNTILILGGSYAGLSVAHYLLRHVVPQLTDGTSVVLVSPSAEVVVRTASPRAIISDSLFDQSKLFVGVAASFAQYPEGSFRFIHGSATTWDHAARTVAVTHAGGAGSEAVAYRSLVIATGATTSSPLFGLNTGDAADLKAAWAAFRAALPAAKSIVIAGGGPTGVETAGELGEHLNGHAGWFASRHASPKVDITLVTGAARLLPVLRPALAAKAEAQLAKVGVKVLTGVRVRDDGSADGSAGAVHLDNGSELKADIFIPATGATPNTGFVADKTLLAADGRIATNVATLRVDAAGPRVYAIGDASTYARQAIHILFEAVPVVCANIERDLLLDAGLPGAAATDRVFSEDKRETHIVPIGKSQGVGSVMDWRLPAFLVWLIKGRDYWLSTTPPLWNGKMWAKRK